MLPFYILGKRAIRIDAFDRRAPEQKDARPVPCNPCGGGDVLDGTAASPTGAGVGFGAVEQERVMHRDIAGFQFDIDSLAFIQNGWIDLVENMVLISF